MPNNDALEHYVNWICARGKDGNVHFQRIHIKPGLCFHRILQKKDNTSGTSYYIHSYKEINDSTLLSYYFSTTSDGYSYIGYNYVPEQISLQDDKSTLSGKFNELNTDAIYYSTGAFKIVEAKSDQGRPYDFT